MYVAHIFSYRLTNNMIGKNIYIAEKSLESNIQIRKVLLFVSSVMSKSGS